MEIIHRYPASWHKIWWQLIFWRSYTWEFRSSTFTIAWDRTIRLLKPTEAKQTDTWGKVANELWKQLARNRRALPGQEACAQRNESWGTRCEGKPGRGLTLQQPNQTKMTSDGRMMERRISRKVQQRPSSSGSPGKCSSGCPPSGSLWSGPCHGDQTARWLNNSYHFEKKATTQLYGEWGMIL